MLPAASPRAPGPRSTKKGRDHRGRAARHFDTNGYGNTSTNTITHTGKFDKGAMYCHFPSEEAIAEHLISSDWKRTVNDSIGEATATGPSATAGRS
ncbi:hypothetical protein ACIGKR_32700 [Rhodococcus qingshengii]|uniref:hypothetical protein n=1 Tax=Rhodococcus qingshengii TaxID=334542 RepID=UPI0037C7740D